MEKMSCESPVNQINSIIELLITPVSPARRPIESTLLQSTKANVISATRCLKRESNLLWLKDAMNEIVLEGPSEDVYWEFTKISLQLLVCLSSQLNSAREKYSEQMREHKRGDGQSASLQLDILSKQQQKNVRDLLQFIACLGISRNLMPGVEASVRQLSKFGTFLTSGDEHKSSDFHKYQMMYSTVQALNKCCEHPALGGLILSKHLGDILAALCQLSFAPLKKLPESEVNDAATNENNQQMNSVLAMCETACGLLNNLVEKTYQPMVIRQLLILHGSDPVNLSKTGTTTREGTQWWKTGTHKLLLERLVKEQGVQSLIRGILDFSGKKAKSTPIDWARCDVVAGLIASGTNVSLGKETCLQTICPQILDLLDSDFPQFQMVASLTIKAIALAEPKLAQQHLINPVIEPLLKCAYYDETNQHKPTEDDLFGCVKKLHKIFVVGPDSDETFAAFLCPIVTLLMNMFAFLCSGRSDMRSLLQGVICFFLKHADSKVALNSLTEFLFPFNEVSKSLQLSPKLKFVHGNSGGVAVDDRTSSESDEQCWLDANKIKIAAQIDLLSQIQKEALVVDYFLAILQDLTLTIGDDGPDDRCIDESGGDGQSDQLHLMELAEIKKQQQVRKSLLVDQTLSALCQHPTLQESILNDKAWIIQFLKVTFERGSKCCDATQKSGEMEAKTLTRAMTVLSMIINGKEKPEIKTALKSCLDSLGVIAKKHHSNDVRSLAEELTIAIGSHGVVSSTEETRSVNELTNPGKISTSSFQQALEDLIDPDPPTRGHALLVISKLLQSRDKEAMENSTRLTAALQESLDNEDSYNYLMAIRAFEFLASAFPDTTIKHLIHQYSNEEVPISAEFRMKFGEVLVRVTRSLGEVIPKYRDPLLGAFLSASKNTDPHVRASSLSNLGEACKGLRYSMGACTLQIFKCLTNLIKLDSSSEVRRAAVQAFTSILKGMGKDSLKIHESHMSGIYRLLMLVYRTDEDDVVRLHAQLAMEELKRF